MRLWNKATAQWRGSLRSVLAIALATCLWLPCLHLVFRKDLSVYRVERGVSPAARELAATYLAIWSEPGYRERELAKMRVGNPEWDFMSRTYFVLALANMAMRDSAYRGEARTIINGIIDNTLQIEREKGFEHFLLGYGREGAWCVKPARSLFIDGEIAVMLGAGRLVEDDGRYGSALADRIEKIIRQMSRGAVLCGESYPNECWAFCNTVALAAIRMYDALDGTDHSAFLSSWVAMAKRKLVDSQTGLLISAFDVDGAPLPCGFGPEGSSIWMVTHMLQLVDPDFARDQYWRARKVFGRSVVGFGYSREWPEGVQGAMDVDSGPVVPGLGASASASGLAILGAAAFDDDVYFRQLLTSLEVFGFPVRKNGALRYMASNQTGDAVLLYAMTQGPLWSEVTRRLVTR